MPPHMLLKGWITILTIIDTSCVFTIMELSSEETVGGLHFYLFATLITYNITETDVAVDSQMLDKLSVSVLRIIDNAFHHTNAIVTTQ